MFIRSQNICLLPTWWLCTPWKETSCLKNWEISKRVSCISYLLLLFLKMAHFAAKAVNLWSLKTRIKFEDFSGNDLEDFLETISKISLSTICKISLETICKISLETMWKISLSTIWKISCQQFVRFLCQQFVRFLWQQFGRFLWQLAGHCIMSHVRAKNREMSPTKSTGVSEARTIWISLDCLL